MRTALLAALLSVTPARAQAPGGWSDAATLSPETNILLQLQQIDEELTRVRLESLELEDKALQLDEQRTRHVDRLAVADAQLARQRTEVRAWLTTLYRLHRRGLARVVFGAEDPTELRRRATYLMAIVEASNGQMTNFLGTITEHKALMKTVERDIDQLGATRTELQVKEEELAERRERRVALLEQIRSQRNLAVQAMDQYGQVRQDLGGQFGGGGGTPTGSWGGGWSGSAAPPPAAAPPAAAVSSGRPVAANRTFRSAHGHLAWPAAGRTVRRFGAYTDPLTGRQEQSYGIDIAADYGTPVRAVFDGQVVMADYISGYGQTVAIAHDAQFTSVYAHLSGLRVQKGQRVAPGDVLGLVGNSGLTDGDGYMLTFEVRYNNSAQDPLPWLSPR